ncbi:ADP-ribosylglycohydrolase family protein [Aestuariimicrobium sp. T2.26MG-19.2B]|uniref:ADP-ribosylglycohydrolase family protein n=1 Tax=Aestuariimicrobium sp. T2.26MG-19.2B TaxID=3040679 RepID=UPI0024778C7B|nr:ADP-ribosylglycohydrolase family protein [Aestuariimicrobium sp. T2.26MG-19.2B]CAI9409951.1 ADP-ribosyl-[dinitrogen reductase] glycohydrolase [Aestuariimicrobium sp. T2.26MG-19.2B]
MTPSRSDLETYRSRVRGSLLGGAIGDALGGPVEFWKTEKILARCGEGGVREYVPWRVDGRDGHGWVTDDTQMTLFAVEGMIRWLDTQDMAGPDGESDGWLAQEGWLYSRRAPGNTCLTALRSARAGARRPRQFGAAADNDSKGCGGVMRSAPLGLLPPWGWAGLDFCYSGAAEAAGHTHGHPTGQIASGALAVLVGAIVRGQGLREATRTMIEVLRERDSNGETLRAVQAAIDLGESVGGVASTTTMESLGGGWIAEEALAMALHAALVFPEPDQMLALAYAVTHSGDSDSTGAICGNILGALHGETALPPSLVFEVEGRGTILELADDFVLEFTGGEHLHGDWGPHTRWTDRYPGW